MTKLGHKVVLGRPLEETFRIKLLKNTYDLEALGFAKFWTIRAEAPQQVASENVSRLDRRFDKVSDAAMVKPPWRLQEV